MTRRAITRALLALLSAGICQGQSPAFEVAAIKPSDPDEARVGLNLRGSEFSTINTSVGHLMNFAFEVHTHQIAGGPAWLNSAKFDIIAKPEGRDRPNLSRLRAMIQTLLADRFHLRFHREQKELPVYAITIDKNGARLKLSERPAAELPNFFFKGPAMLHARNASVADLAGALQTEVLEVPVVDHTTLAGRFDFDLNWTPDETQPGGRRGGTTELNPADPPGLAVAMREQLGLNLRTAKAQIEFLVVDSLEKPSEN